MKRSERLSHFSKITQPVYGRPSNRAERVLPWRPHALSLNSTGPALWSTYACNTQGNRLHGRMGAFLCALLWWTSWSWAWLWLICSSDMHFSKGTSGESDRRGDSCPVAGAIWRNGSIHKPLLIISLGSALRYTLWKTKHGSLGGAMFQARNENNY